MKVVFCGIKIMKDMQIVHVKPYIETSLKLIHFNFLLKESHWKGLVCLIHVHAVLLINYTWQCSDSWCSKYDLWSITCVCRN